MSNRLGKTPENLRGAMLLSYGTAFGKKVVTSQAAGARS